jgi:hypothetical protein
MIPTNQAAKLLGVSVQYLRKMCRAGRVPGAIKIGDGPRCMWVFPDKPKIEEKK